MVTFEGLAKAINNIDMKPTYPLHSARWKMQGVTSQISTADCSWRAYAILTLVLHAEDIESSKSVRFNNMKIRGSRYKPYSCTQGVEIMRRHHPQARKSRHRKQTLQGVRGVVAGRLTNRYITIRSVYQHHHSEKRDSPT